MNADDERLTLAAAGALIGISGEAIRKATVAGRIVRDAEGRVGKGDVLRYATGRRAPRGGAHRNHPTKQPQPTPSTGASSKTLVDDAQPCVDADGVWRAAWAHALIIQAGATELPPILMRHLPAELVRSVVLEWAATMRREIVGAGMPLEPLCATEGWPPPPGGGHWRDHQLFTESIAGDVNWQEIADIAAAWRAERGMPAL